MDENPVSINHDGDVVTPDPEDEMSDLDGCCIPIEEVTLDEDLPATEGGVA
jgi:hypothetical protein